MYGVHFPAVMQFDTDWCRSMPNLVSYRVSGLGMLFDAVRRWKLAFWCCLPAVVPPNGYNLSPQIIHPCYHPLPTTVPFLTWCHSYLPSSNPLLSPLSIITHFLFPCSSYYELTLWFVGTKQFYINEAFNTSYVVFWPGQDALDAVTMVKSDMTFTCDQG